MHGEWQPRVAEPAHQLVGRRVRNHDDLAAAREHASRDLDGFRQDCRPALRLDMFDGGRMRLPTHRIDAREAVRREVGDHGGRDRVAAILRVHSEVMEQRTLASERIFIAEGADPLPARRPTVLLRLASNRLSRMSDPRFARAALFRRTKREKRLFEYFPLRRGLACRVGPYAVEVAQELHPRTANTRLPR